MNARPRRNTSRRRGALVAEAAFAAAILGIALALTVQLLGGVLAARRAADLRQVAAQAAANTMEAIAALPVSDRTAEALEALRLDPETARLLPGGRLSVVVSENGSGASAGLVRVTVEVRWPGRGDRPDAPVRLVAWLAGRGGEG